jgi:hypothetical protein
MKNGIRSVLVIFLDIKTIVHKEFVLAGPEVNSSYYCDVLWLLLKMCGNFALKFGDT